MRIVRHTGKPIARVARDLGINAGTLVIGLLRIVPNAKAHKAFDRDIAELKRLRVEERRAGRTGAQGLIESAQKANTDHARPRLGVTDNAVRFPVEGS